MVVFWRLLLAYFLAEYVLQSKNVYFKKFESLYGRLLHGLIVFVLSLILCRNFLDITWVNIFGLHIHGLPALAVLFALHLIIDEAYRRKKAIVKRFKHTIRFVVHEAAHILAIFIVCPDVGLTDIANLFPEKWVIVLSALFFVSYFPKILVSAYEQDRYGNGYDTEDESFLMMLPRAIFFFLCLLPGYSWIIYCLIWLAFCVMLKKQRIIDISTFNLVSSVIVSVGVGLLVRANIYLWL